MKKSNIEERASRSTSEVTETKTKRYLELHAEGKTVAEIVKETGATYQTVYGTLKAKGVTINKVRPEGEKSKTEAIMELWDQEIPVNEIAAKLKEQFGWDMKYQQVYNTLKRRGAFDPKSAKAVEATE